MHACIICMHNMHNINVPYARMHEMHAWDACISCYACIIFMHNMVWGLISSESCILRASLCADRQTDRQTSKQAGRQTDRRKDGQTERDRGRQTSGNATIVTFTCPDHGSPVPGILRMHSTHTHTQTERETYEWKSHDRDIWHTMHA